MKKKILIICLILFILLTVGIYVIFNLNNDKKKVNNINIIENTKIDFNFDDLKVEEEPEIVEITFKNDIALTIGSKIPTVYELTGQNIEAELKVYFNNELVTTDTLNLPGTYTIELTYNNETFETSIIVKDITSPTLSLNKKTIYYGKTYKINDFVKECVDDSGEKCTLNYKNKNMANYKKVGTYDIVIVATDTSGNITEQTTKLVIKKKATTTNNNNTSNNDKDNNQNNNNNNNNNGSSNDNSNNDNNNNNNNNDNDNQDNNNEDNKEEEVTLVNTVTETTTSTTTKYGVKITDTIKITYNVYSDGSKVEKSRKVTKTTYDYSGYNATTDDLKSEAITLTNNNTKIANEVLGYLNTYRAEANVNSLELDRTLTIAANIRALELAYSQKFSHERPNGTKYYTAITDIGGSWSYVGENVAGGYPSAKSVSEAWKESSGHYANMINSRYNKVGIGHVYVNGMDYWVQLFTS